MKVTGVLLREAIKRWELRATTAQAAYKDSLAKFDDEQKKHPVECALEWMQAENAVSSLQTAQSRYNLIVNVDVGGIELPLAEVVKRIGGAGRMEKAWRDTVGKKKSSRWSDDEEVRKEGEKRPTSTMSREELLENAEAAARYASVLRTAMAYGNTVRVEHTELKIEEKLLTK